MKLNLYLKIFAWIIFCLIIYPPVFQDIDRLPLQFWDESRNANNALEMAENGNYLIRYYNGQPDMWELNPPLLTWLQSISMKVFGFNEFGLRLPTSLAVLSTVFLLVYFFKKEFDTYWPGIAASMVLITSSGYIHTHIARTGDHDAVLILFLTAASLNYFRHLKHFKHSSRFLTFSTIFLILAVYTKSVAGLFTLPGLFLYTLYKKQLKDVFTDYRTYISFIVFGLIVSVYYPLREFYAPGTWDIFWNKGMFPRLTNNDVNQELFNPGYWWYFKNLFESRFTYWLPALLLPLVLYKRLKTINAWDIAVFSYIISLSTLLVLSGLTKHFWYDGPAYPFFSILIGLGLYSLVKYAGEKSTLHANLNKAVALIFLTTLFAFPYSSIIDKVYKPKEWDTRLYNGLFIRHLNKENKTYLNYSMFFQGYNAPVEFYVKALNSDGKHHVKVLGDQIQHLTVHDSIMSCDWESYHILDSAFYLSTIEEFEHCRMYVVDSLRPRK